MPIDHISSLIGALAKGPAFPGAHNRNWVSNHGQAHDGARGGFPLGAGGGPQGIGRPMPGTGMNLPNLPHGGPPGIDRPNSAGAGPPGVDRPNLPNVAGPPGVDRPNHPHGGPPGLDRPNHPHGAPAGIDRPDHPHGAPPGADRAGPGLVAQVANTVLDIAGLPRHLPAQGQHAGQPAQLPAPAAAAQAQGPQSAVIAAQAQVASLAFNGPATVAPALVPATTTLQPMAQQLPSPQQVQPAPVRPDAAPQLAHAAQPARADAVQLPTQRAEPAPVPRGDMAGAERMALLQRAAAAPIPLAGTLAATTAANPPATTHAAAMAATAAGTTMATPPAAQAATQAVEARSASPLIAADRGQVVSRADIAGTYTGEGPHRRGLRRAARALPGGLSGLLVALGAQGSTGAGRDPAAAERELRAAMMQWLFWLLAVIAYGCVAFAVIGLLPPGSLGGGAGTPVDNRAWTGGFALAGLVAAVGAWWFARGMARGGEQGSHDGDERS